MIKTTFGKLVFMSEPLTKLMRSPVGSGKLKYDISKMFKAVQYEYLKVTKPWEERLVKANDYTLRGFEELRKDKPEVVTEAWKVLENAPVEIDRLPLNLEEIAELEYITPMDIEYLSPICFDPSETESEHEAPQELPHSSDASP